MTCSFFTSVLKLTGLLTAWTCFLVQAQGYDMLDVEEYIQAYRQTAMDEMKRVGIPASITLAQGIIESGAGKSVLATQANNHFGIKCHTDWSGPGYYYDDDRKNECFRHYDSVMESFLDHSEFLSKRQRYAVLFTYDIRDYKSWARGLKSCGYATNPQYANLLIKCIEDYDLHQWDLDEADRADWFAGINKTPVREQGRSVASGATGNENRMDEANDPWARVFVFNDIKCLTLKKEESLTALGTTYEISIQRLMRYNDLTDTGQLKEGDRLYLQPKRHNGDEQYHAVLDGETMFDIAKQHGIQLAKLYEKNLMKNGSQPAPGETIWLRETRNSPPLLLGKTAVAEVNKPEEDAAGSTIYTVERGDTLFSISKKYNLTIEELKAINRRRSEQLYVGEKLRVSR